MLRRMAAGGFNTVRVFINFQSGEVIESHDSMELSSIYLDNVTDFLAREKGRTACTSYCRCGDSRDPPLHTIPWEAGPDDNRRKSAIPARRLDSSQNAIPARLPIRESSSSEIRTL